MCPLTLARRGTCFVMACEEFEVLRIFWRIVTAVWEQSSTVYDFCRLVAECDQILGDAYYSGNGIM